jgi:hypothetical protein
MQAQRTSKRCGRCGEEKPLAEFYRARTARNPEARQSYCKACAIENATRWRVDNRDRSAAYQRQRRVADPTRLRGYDRARWLRSPAVQLTLAARSVPCVDCGVQLPPEVMELDHVRGEKSFGFGGSGFRERQAAEVAAEISKCDVRCPNCHRLRHYHEREERRAA